MTAPRREQTIDGEACIPNVHTNPEYIDGSTLQCRVVDDKFDRPQAKLALGSDDARTTFQTRYNVVIRDVDPGNKV